MRAPRILAALLPWVLASCQAQLFAPSGSFQLQAWDQANDQEVIVAFRDPGGRAAVEQTHPGLFHRQSLLLPATHVYRLDPATDLQRLSQDPRVAYVEPNSKLQAYYLPNDPYLPQLWAFQKISMPSAWDTTTGASDVLVAVVDTGVDYRHPDLAGQVVLGPDLVNGDGDPLDDQGHGTHVAGTLAALGDNALGVVGMAFHGKVLAVKVLDQSGSGTLAHVADGMMRAQQLGARVINLSLGGTTSSTTLQNAVDYVTGQGALVVAAAGNSNTWKPSYPAAYPNALAVGASDPNDLRASFSNYGDWVDVAAPGVSILSTTPGSYQAWNGTSMAAPHVAGAAALLLAHTPGMSISDLRTALVTTGDPVAGFESNPALKRLNVARALTNQVVTPLPSPTPTPSPSPSAKPGKRPRSK